MRLGRDGAKPLHLKRVLVIAALVAAPFGSISAAFAQSSVTGSNDSSGAEATSGDANGTNSSSGQTGLSSGGSNGAGTQDVNGSSGTNVQDGNNRTRVSQTTNVRTGDAVGGQIIGGVVGGGGSLVVNATNRSDGVDITTGDAEGSNNANVVTGLVAVDDGAFVGDAIGQPNASTSDLNNAVGRNLQDGNNTTSVSQRNNVQTGDGVGGQVIGAVVSRGTTDIAAANLTRDTTIETGEADATNDLSAFVGLLSATTGTVGQTGEAPLADVTNATGTNVQDGNNRLSASQSAHAQTGDGVGGQVLGVVSAGATRVDASNATIDSTIETGSATAENHGGAFVGLVDADTVTVVPADLTDVNGTNLQDGSNNSRLSQSADAVTGDAVAGQVAGVVTSAGGSAAVTLANRSEGIDATSGSSDFVNETAEFTGLSNTTGSASVGEAADTALSSIFKSAVS